MRNKYEDWILHLILTFFLIVMFKKVHHPKHFSQKDFYSKSLSFRFYIFSIPLIIGFIVSLLREFIKLYNE